MAREGIRSLRQRPSDKTFYFEDVQGAIRELLQEIPGYEPGAVLIVNEEGEPEFVRIPDAEAVDADGQPLADASDGPDPSSTPSEQDSGAGEAPGGAPTPVDAPPTDELDAPTGKDAPADSLETEIKTQESIAGSEEEAPEKKKRFGRK